MSEPARPRIGVVGGGMLGLTLALRLRERGHPVTVFEAAPELGGLASAWSLGDVVWDRHYHVTLLSDSHLRRVLADLGLEGELVFRTTRTGFYTDGRFHSMSNAVEFLRFPPLSLPAKLRLGLTIALASRMRDWRRLEEVPVGDWLVRLSGRETFDRIWLPLLRAKLGEAWRDTSAAFLWATIQRMYAARRTGMKTEMFGHVRGGYARVLSRFAEVLRERGAEIRTSSPVRAVVREGPGLTIHLASGGAETFDRVVVTGASPLAARLCPDLPASERALAEGVRYQGIACASLLLSRPLRGFYVTNLTDPWVPFTAVVEMTALVDPSELGGRHLVYLPKYAPESDDLMNLDDQAVRDRFVPALRRMVPDLRDDEVLAFRVSRVRHVFPIPVLSYSTRLPPVRTSVPGLFLVGSAHIVNGTLNVNETVHLAETTVPLVAAP